MNNSREPTTSGDAGASLSSQSASPEIVAAFEHASSQCQRWKERKVRYRPPGELFDPSRAEVVVLGESDAKRFIERNHYSGSYPAAKFRVGLLAKPRWGAAYLGGVAVYSVPMTQQVIPAVLGMDASLGVELGRLVLLDTPELTANAESWFVARAHRALRSRFPELRGVVAYCDPIERLDASGQLVKRSHTGVVYRALGCQRKGISSPRTLWLLPDGQVASERAMSKLRAGECGRDYAEQQLRNKGAPVRGPLEGGDQYLKRLKQEGFLRPLRHPGNLRFAWEWKGTG